MNHTTTGPDISNTPPPLLDPWPDRIPEALIGETRWAIWKAVWNAKRGKYDKVPLNPHSLHGISTHKPWWSFDQARAGYEKNWEATAGLGFNLTSIQGFVGIDLDRCVTGDVIEPWASEIVERSNSYAELSPSGRGVRIFAKGSIPNDWVNNPQGIEVYGGHGARFLTVTGHQIAGTPADVQSIPEGALDWLAEKYKPTRAAPENLERGDLPDLIDAESLPAIGNLNLSPEAHAFLDGEDFPDRSHALAITTRSLYLALGSTHQGKMLDALVFSILANNNYAWEVATSHRPRSDEASADEAAHEYLWKHHCAKVRSVADGPKFEDISGDSETAEERSHAELQYVDFTTLAHTRPPMRRWIVEEWLPIGTVAALFGPPGVGKSLLAEQLAIAVANGDSWLGFATTKGPVIGLFCEDDENELKWRALRIFNTGFLEPVEASAGLHLDARAGKSNALIVFGHDRIGRPTSLMKELDEQCATVRPILVILDNVAQLFTGVENDRSHVTAFCNALTGVARKFDCTVLLLGHPSKAEDSEYSGSTAWEAAVRTRLFLKRQDDGTLKLHKAKANYSAISDVSLEYRAPGVFVPLAPGSSNEPQAVEDAKPVVLNALQTFAKRQQATSHLNTARNYLVKQMRVDGLLDGLSEAVASKALSALIDGGVLVPNAELPWKNQSRHKAQGLALRETTDHA